MVKAKKEKLFVDFKREPTSAEKKAFDANQVEIDKLAAHIKLQDEYIAYLLKGGRVGFERWVAERG